MAVRAACRALLAVKSWILPETGLCRELTALLRFTVSCTGVPFGSSSGVSPSWGKGFRGVRAPRNRKGRGEPPFRLSDDAYRVPKVLRHPVGTVVLCHNQRCSKDLHAENFLPPPSDPGRPQARTAPGDCRCYKLPPMDSQQTIGDRPPWDADAMLAGQPQAELPAVTPGGAESAAETAEKAAFGAECPGVCPAAGGAERPCVGMGLHP